MDDPLGPDAYGYYAYDNGDILYSNAPYFNWIEIDPDLGGDGEELNLNDGGNNQDDVTTISLPFTFTFYGLDYDEVSVCSNGWISFGETDMTSFRNYTIQGPGWPSPIVAVFWDDLKTTSGGDVITHYIEPQSDSPGMFIVEWSDVRTYDANSVESFQAILYQNAVLPNFDGEINNLLHFIGVKWNKSVLNYVEYAKSKRITTPSYSQVTEPIYKRAKFRWLKYKDFFDKYLDTNFKFYINQFGYKK